MNPHLFLAFLATSLVLAVTPGPGVVYVIARTAAQGKCAGLAAVAGVALGNLCNAVAASFGLAALFAVSATAFTVVKLAGAAYLVYLGIRALRADRTDGPLPALHAPAPAIMLRGVFREGFTVALLNPKTALFFAALLPQFIDPAYSAEVQAIVLAVVFVAVAVVTDSAYVLAASVGKARLGNARILRRFGRYATAATFLGLGFFAALAEARSTR